MSLTQPPPAMPDDKHPDHQRFLAYWDRCVDRVAAKMLRYGRSIAENDEDGFLSDNVADKERIEKVTQKGLLRYMKKCAETTLAMQSTLHKAKNLLNPSD